MIKALAQEVGSSMIKVNGKLVACGTVEHVLEYQDDQNDEVARALKF
jgi:hypothetical protein